LRLHPDQLPRESYKYCSINVKPRLTSVSSGEEVTGASPHFWHHCQIPSLAWAVISTVLQLDSTVNTIVAATSNKSASAVIWKKSPSTLTQVMTHW